MLMWSRLMKVLAEEGRWFGDSGSRCIIVLKVLHYSTSNIV